MAGSGWSPEMLLYDSEVKVNQGQTQRDLDPADAPSEGTYLHTFLLGFPERWLGSCAAVSVAAGSRRDQAAGGLSRGRWTSSGITIRLEEWQPGELAGDCEAGVRDGDCDTASLIVQRRDLDI